MSRNVERTTSSRSISSAADSPVNLGLWSESELESGTTAISGRKCAALLRISGQCGSWAKTFLESEITSTRFVTIWKPVVMKSSRLKFRLRLLERRTSDTGHSLLPTLLARDSRSVRGSQDRPGRQGGASLLPTLTKSSGQKSSGLQANGKTYGPSRLNPEWAEWFMGFPRGWTDLPGGEWPPLETL